MGLHLLFSYSDLVQRWDVLGEVARHGTTPLMFLLRPGAEVRHWKNKVGKEPDLLFTQTDFVQR